VAELLEAWCFKGVEEFILIIRRCGVALGFLNNQLGQKLIWTSSSLEPDA
jgi:hypothetical protein